MTKAYLQMYLIRMAIGSPVAFLRGGLHGFKAADGGGALRARQVSLLRKALCVARQKAKLPHERLLGHIQAILAIRKLDHRPACPCVPLDAMRFRGLTMA